MRLLLVDNPADGIEALAKALHRRYHQVDRCYSYETFISGFQGQPYDRIIVALEMDRDEGYHIIESITDIHPRQPIITYSAEAERSSSKEGCAFCVAHYRKIRLAKPLRLPNLIDTIAHFESRQCPFADLTATA